MKNLITFLVALLFLSLNACTDKIDIGTVATGKFNLRYRIEGAGRPAIVIGSATYLPRTFSQNLRKHLRLVFLDHRGYAPSPGPMDATAFAPDTLLDDIERARQESSGWIASPSLAIPSTRSWHSSTPRSIPRTCRMLS